MPRRLSKRSEVQVSIEVEEFGDLTIGLISKEANLSDNKAVCRTLMETYKLEDGPEVDPARVTQKSAVQSLLGVCRSVKSEANEETADTPVVKTATGKQLNMSQTSQLL